jgi:hypothetical protein
MRHQQPYFAINHQGFFSKQNRGAAIAALPAVRINVPSMWRCVTSFENIPVLEDTVGRECSVGIATRYGLDDPGENIRTRPDRPWGPPSLLYGGYRVFPGGKAAEAWH